MERARGRGRRLRGQLLGDPSGDTEMQQPLALPGDREAAHRHGPRSALLADLQPRCPRPGPGEFQNTALSTSTPRAGPPPSLVPRHTRRRPSHAPAHRRGQVCLACAVCSCPIRGPARESHQKGLFLGWPPVGRREAQWRRSQTASQPAPGTALGAWGRTATLPGARTCPFRSRIPLVGGDRCCRACGTNKGLALFAT